MGKGRNAGPEMDEENFAATKLQAVQRGKNARAAMKEQLEPVVVRPTVLGSGGKIGEDEKQLRESLKSASRVAEILSVASERLGVPSRQLRLSCVDETGTVDLTVNVTTDMELDEAIGLFKTQGVDTVKIR